MVNVMEDFGHPFETKEIVALGTGDALRHAHEVWQFLQKTPGWENESYGKCNPQKQTEKILLACFEIFGKG